MLIWRMVSSLTSRSVGTESIASIDLSLAASLARSDAWYLGMRISGGVSASSSASSSFLRLTFFWLQPILLPRTS